MSLSSTGAPVVVIVGVARSASLSGRRVDEVGAVALVLDRLRCPCSRTTICAWRSSVKNAPQRLADRCLVVVDQEVDLRRVVEHSLRRRDRVEPRERLRRVGVACRLARLGRRARVRRAEQDLAGDALRRVARVGLCTRRVVVHSSAVSGLTTLVDVAAVPRSSSLDRLPLARFAGVKSSSTVWPLSMVTSASIAWPPNRSW